MNKDQTQDKFSSSLQSDKRKELREFKNIKIGDYSQNELKLLNKHRKARKFHLFIFRDIIPFMQGLTSILGLIICYNFIRSGQMVERLNSFIFVMCALGIWVALLPWIKTIFPHLRFLQWHRNTLIKMNKKNE